MKIGILTYHRAENYGALLQAYALITYLKNLGHEAEFVDYWPEYHVEHYRIFSFLRFKRYSINDKVKYLLKFFLWGVPKYLRKFRLQSFMKGYMGLNSIPRYQTDNEKTERYDLVIYGSDQIWRKQGINGNQFNPWYFGSSNVVANSKVTYAASMGVIETNKEDELFLKKCMKQFDHISVREVDLCEYLNGLGISSEIVCDPTFLLSKEEWRKLIKPSKKKEKYILLYNLLQMPESVKFAQSLSKATGFPIKEINMQQSFSHAILPRYITCASLNYFLGLIDNAEYVVSNSFHGVAFSVIFEKQFFAVGMGNKANRVVSLLQSLGIQERYFFNPEYTPLSEINYKDVEKRKDEMVDQSTKFLKRNMVK